MSGINSILLQLAETAVRNTEEEKKAFVPMAGDPAAAGGMPPMDPAMMDPAMAGGMPPMDPAMMDPAAAGMDPMAMAAMGQDPAAIMAAQGAPVDPMMAQAGGAAGVPAPAEAAPAEEAPKKGGGQKEKLEEIHSMLTKIMGVLVGKGLLAPTELGGILGEEGEGAQEMAPEAPAEPGVPAEQKVASDAPDTVGSVVEDEGEMLMPKKKTAAVKDALANLILSLEG